MPRSVLIPLLEGFLAGPQLTNDLAANATVITPVLSNGAAPAELPFAAVLEEGTAREEQVLVTAVNRTTGVWTITRGLAGAAVVHPAGAAITIGLNRDDLLALWSLLERPPDGARVQTGGGIRAWNYDLAQATQNAASTQATGRVLAIKVPLRRKTLVTAILAQVQTAGVTLTANQNLAWLCNADGTLIAGSVTGDQSGVWTSTGYKSMTIAGGPILVDPGTAGFVWVCLLSVGTTPPLWRDGVASGVVGNAGAPAAELRCGRDAAAGVTAAQAITPGTLAVWEVVWAGLA